MPLFPQTRKVKRLAMANWESLRILSADFFAIGVTSPSAVSLESRSKRRAAPRFSPTRFIPLPLLRRFLWSLIASRLWGIKRYTFGGGDQRDARRCVERRDGEHWLGPTLRRNTDVKRTKGRSASCK